MKEKFKKLAKKTGLDALGILICSLIAILAPRLIPALEGLQIPVAVACGIWLYIPLRELIGKTKVS